MKIYREIYRNTDFGIASIDGILNFVESKELKTILLRQKEVLDELNIKAKENMTPTEIEQAEPSKISEKMMDMSIFMDATVNHNSEHLAKKMIDGYNMGLNSVTKCINDFECDSDTLPSLATETCNVYEKCIKELRKFL